MGGVGHETHVVCDTDVNLSDFVLFQFFISYLIFFFGRFHDSKEKKLFMQVVKTEGKHVFDLHFNY